MTYEEREKMLCNDCEAKENCSYISRNLERKCSFRETVMYGWELGWKDAIDNACEWLKDNASNYIIEHPFSSDVDFEEDKMIEDFKKYMEDKV